MRGRSTKSDVAQALDVGPFVELEPQPAQVVQPATHLELQLGQEVGTGVVSDQAVARLRGC